MNDGQGQQEPTMEEILASIRRIISDEEQPEGKPGEEVEADNTPVAAVPEPEEPEEPETPQEETPLETDAAPEEAEAEAEESAEALASEENQEGVLELTEMVKEDGSVVSLREEQARREAAPENAAPEAVEGLESELMSQAAATSATAAFASLAGAVSSSRGVSIGAGNRTLEDLVKELLRPMLKEWLDSNLPPMVQRIVEKEISKLAGHAEDNTVRRRR